MSKKIELSTLAFEIFALCIILMYKNVSTAEHYDMVYRLQLYHYEGPPKIQQPFSADTLIAGTIDTLVAKIFDAYDVWRSEYETPDSGRMYIRWKVEDLYENELTRGNLLSDTVGHIVVVNSQNVYRGYRIIASFKEVFKDTLHLFVKPVSKPHILRIFPEKTKKPYYDIRKDTLQLTKSVTAVYAVILDQFGNFIHYGKDFIWSCSDTTLIVTPGDTSVGECILTATTTNFTSARIIVRNIKEGIVDTFTVINNIVNTTFDKNQKITVISNPVFYTDQGKLRIQFPFTANRTICFYTLSGNCVSSLQTRDACCSIVLRPGVYILTAGVVGMCQSTSTLVRVSR